MKLLDKSDQRGMGGILLEDVEESLPNCPKHLKVCLTINKPSNGTSMKQITTGYPNHFIAKMVICKCFFFFYFAVETWRFRTICEPICGQEEDIVLQ